MKTNYTESVERLEPSHRLALDWFRERRGMEVPWTRSLDDGTLLVSTPKGIYKPTWTKYALSVRQTLKSRYPDREPIHRSDGSWTYMYHQEGDDPGARDDEFTNVGLMECVRDRVPVGVMRQTHGKPQTRYFVLGVGLVAGWRDGFFQIEGFASDGAWQPTAIDGLRGGPVLEASDDGEPSASFDPSSVGDTRERVFRQIAARRGQATFRRRLLRVYGGRCALTGCPVEAALEAAHVTPFLGEETNAMANGILLRADLHTLWDLGLVALDESSYSILVARALEGTDYEMLAGVRASVPARSEDRPSTLALRQHRELAQL